VVAEEKKQIPIGEGLFYQPTSPGDMPYLIGSRCSVCGNIFFPRKVICPVCLKENTLEEIPLSRRGKIYSYSIAHLSMPGFPAPYIQAYVDIEGGPRVFSLITGCEAKEGVLKIGDEVELEIGKITEDEEGNDIVGYTFRPVSK
jgi:uncharacterized OB-fold protein